MRHAPNSVEQRLAKTSELSRPAARPSNAHTALSKRNGTPLRISPDCPPVKGADAYSGRRRRNHNCQIFSGNQRDQRGRPEGLECRARNHERLVAHANPLRPPTTKLRDTKRAAAFRRRTSLCIGNLQPKLQYVDEPRQQQHAPHPTKVNVCNWQPQCWARQNLAGKQRKTLRPTTPHTGQKSLHAQQALCN